MSNHLINKGKLILNYFRLKKYLVEKTGRSPVEAAREIRDIRRMEPKLLGLYLRWFLQNEKPQERFCGISLQDVMQRHELDETAGFLALDYIVKDEDEAIFALGEPRDEITLSKAALEKLHRAARERGLAPPPAETEDTSDLESEQP